MQPVSYDLNEPRAASRFAKGTGWWCTWAKLDHIFEPPVTPDIWRQNGKFLWLIDVQWHDALSPAMMRDILCEWFISRDIVKPGDPVFVWRNESNTPARYARFHARNPAQTSRRDSGQTLG